MSHAVRQPASLSQSLLRAYNRLGFLPVVLVVLVVALSLFVPRFLSVQNVFNVLRSSSYLVIISAGQMLVLIVGGFDLSAPSFRSPASSAPW
jgi:ribose transport system permease protein